VLVQALMLAQLSMLVQLSSLVQLLTLAPVLESLVTSKHQMTRTSRQC
jgi:hypothetical protein